MVARKAIGGNKTRRLLQVMVNGGVMPKLDEFDSWSFG
jgi:hypothetical protein